MRRTYSSCIASNISELHHSCFQNFVLTGIREKKFAKVGPKATYFLCFTENFIERLKECPCNNKNTMISFDVVLLFTNVPLAETINF